MNKRQRRKKGKKELKLIKEEFSICQECGKPYSDGEYEEAKWKGLDLDDWNDYVEFFGIGENPDYE